MRVPAMLIASDVVRAMWVERCEPLSLFTNKNQQFPNAVAVNAVRRRNTQMSENEHKRTQTQVCQKSAKGRKRAQTICKQPGFVKVALLQSEFCTKDFY